MGDQTRRVKDLQPAVWDSSPARTWKTRVRCTARPILTERLHLDGHATPDLADTYVTTGGYPKLLNLTTLLLLRHTFNTYTALAAVALYETDQGLRVRLLTDDAEEVTTLPPSRFAMNVAAWLTAMRTLGRTRPTWWKEITQDWLTLPGPYADLDAWAPLRRDEENLLGVFQPTGLYQTQRSVSYKAGRSDSWRIWQRIASVGNKVAPAGTWARALHDTIDPILYDNPHAPMALSARTA